MTKTKFDCYIACVVHHSCSAESLSSTRVINVSVFFFQQKIPVSKQKTHYIHTFCYLWMQASIILFNFSPKLEKKKIEDNYNMFFHSATVRGPPTSNHLTSIFGWKTLVHIESKPWQDDLTKPESLEINSENCCSTLHKRKYLFFQKK